MYPGLSPMPGSWNAPPWCLAGQTWYSRRPCHGGRQSRGCVSLLRQKERDDKRTGIDGD